MDDFSLKAIGLSLQQSFQNWMNSLTQGWLTETALEEANQPLQTIDFDLTQINQVESSLIDLEAWLTAGVDAPDLGNLFPGSIVSSEAITSSKVASHPSIESQSNKQAFHNPTSDHQVSEHSHDRAFNNSASNSQLLGYQDNTLRDIRDISDTSRFSEAINSSVRASGNSPLSDSGVALIDEHRDRISHDDSSITETTIAQNEESIQDLKFSEITQTSTVQQSTLKTSLTENTHQNRSKSFQFIQGRSIDNQSNSPNLISQKEAAPSQLDRTLSGIPFIRSTILDEDQQIEEKSSPQKNDRPHQPTQGLKELAHFLQHDRTSNTLFDSKVTQSEEAVISKEIAQSEIHSLQHLVWNEAQSSSSNVVSTGLNDTDSTHSVSVTPPFLNRDSVTSHVTKNSVSNVPVRSDRYLTPDSIDESTKASPLINSSNGKENSRQTPQSEEAENLDLETILDAVQNQVNREYRRFYSS